MPPIRIVVALDDRMPARLLLEASLHERLVASPPAVLVAAAVHVLDVLDVIIHRALFPLAVAERLLEDWLHPEAAALIAQVAVRSDAAHAHVQMGVCRNDCVTLWRCFVDMAHPQMAPDRIQRPLVLKRALPRGDEGAVHRGRGQGAHAEDLGA